jgi:plasmid stabilization system protein ParE
MPIQIIPKEAAKLPLWQNILFYFSIGLLCAIFAGYGVLYHFTKKATQDFENIKNAIEQARTSQMNELENQLKSYGEKIGDFSSIIDSHKIISNFFGDFTNRTGFLERNTHPNVFFSGMNLDAAKETVTLFGQTEDFRILGQQISLFRKEELKEIVKSVQLSAVAINKDGKIEFTLVVSFHPKLFK